MATLMQANHEWSTRPADERYKSLEEALGVAQLMRETSTDVQVQRNTLEAFVDADGEVKLVHADGPLALTHFSFGQLASWAQAPGEFLRSLNPSTVVDILNQRLPGIDEELQAQMLIQRAVHRAKARGKNVAKTVAGAADKLRALTSEKYSRIWNADILQRLVELQNGEGSTWQPAPAAFDGSRGIYMGDRDMFCFMVDNERRIFETLPGGGLGRGFFVWNAEGGARSFGIMAFLYEYVCGNHRVWGAKTLFEKRVVHIGDADARSVGELQATLADYANSSAKDDEQRITAAQQLVLGKGKQDVVDFFYARRWGANKRTEMAYDLAASREDWYGAPNTAWAMAGALTEIARDLPNADKRRELEQVAGKVMDLAVA